MVVVLGGGGGGGGEKKHNGRIEAGGVGSNIQPDGPRNTRLPSNRAKRISS